ncbi:hypothetical protein PG988_015130 [Apiospora saccharicola]
MEHTTALDG